MAILGETGMVRYFVLQAKAAEPTIAQVDADLLAQASFRTDAVTVADDEHADHQLGVDGGTARMTVGAGHMLAKLTQVKKVIDRTQKMVFGNIFVKTDG